MKHFYIILSIILLSLKPTFLSNIVSVNVFRKDSVTNSSFLQSHYKRDTNVNISSKFIYITNNLKGTSGQGYYMEIFIGTPSQKLNVLLDTGSSNFALAAKPNPDINLYFNKERSITFHSQNTYVYVPYTLGEWKGILGSDIVRLAADSNKTFNSQLCLITSSSNFFISTSNWQGIVGLAYSNIAKPYGMKTFFDEMVEQWKLLKVFALQLCVTPTQQTSFGIHGTLNVGGVDKSLYTGDLLYVPIRQEWYYEVVITDLALDDVSLAMDCKEYNIDKTIVDSGTTDLRLPDRVFKRLIKAFKQKVYDVNEDFWSGSSVLCYDEFGGPWSLFPVLRITLEYSNESVIDLHLAPQQYIRYIGARLHYPRMNCFKFSIQSSQFGTVLGAVVMEGFYTVFDQNAHRVGFAESTCSSFAPGLVRSKVTGPKLFNGHGAPRDCAYARSNETEFQLILAAYVLGGLLLLVMLLIPFVLVCIYFRRNSYLSDHFEERLTIDEHETIRPSSMTLYSTIEADKSRRID